MLVALYDDINLVLEEHCVVIGQQPLHVLEVVGAAAVAGRHHHTVHGDDNPGRALAVDRSQVTLSEDGLYQGDKGLMEPEVAARGQGLGKDGLQHRRGAMEIWQPVARERAR